MSEIMREHILNSRSNEGNSMYCCWIKKISFCLFDFSIIDAKMKNLTNLIFILIFNRSLLNHFTQNSKLNCAIDRIEIYSWNTDWLKLSNSILAASALWQILNLTSSISTYVYYLSVYLWNPKNLIIISWSISLHLALSLSLFHSLSIPLSLFSIQHDIFSLF